MQRQNNEEMAANLTEKMKSAACGEFEQYLALLAAGEELVFAEQAEAADHLKHCAACTAARARERDMLSVLSETRSEPDAVLLAASRSGLVDAFHREEERA